MNKKRKRKEILDKFGKELMESVRDSVLSNFHDTMDGKLMVSQRSLDLHKRIQGFPETQRELLRDFVYEYVDDTIFKYILWMLDFNHNFDLIYYKDEEKDKDDFISLPAITAGPKITSRLSAYLFAKNGWVEKFSKYPPTIMNDVDAEAL